MTNNDMTLEQAKNYIKDAIDHVFIYLKIRTDFLKVMESTKHYISTWEEHLKRR